VTLGRDIGRSATVSTPINDPRPPMTMRIKNALGSSDASAATAGSCSM
jgi:hypothetical protein